MHKVQFKTRLQSYVDQGIFSARLSSIIENFCRDYLMAIGPQTPQQEAIDLLSQLIELTAKQIQQPYPFGTIHHQIRHPFDYYAFGLSLIKPLVDREKSEVLGEEQLAQIEQQLARGDNCVLFANHQIEPDPQVISLLLEDRHPRLAEEMFFVAGDRVTTDPLAVPLSLGRNLICIYSKKHLDHPPEQKEHKLQHNRSVLQELAKRFSLGRQCIFVAPSGGRDRSDAQGNIQVAPFNSQSVETFYFLAKKSPKPVHFYPLALATFALAPPPPQVQSEIGEDRCVHRTAVFAAFGPELDLNVLGNSASHKQGQRQERAQAVWQIVCELYRSSTKRQ